MSDGSVTINFNGDTKDLEKDINGLSGKIKNGFSKIGNIAGTALKGATVAIGTATTALTGLGVASVNSYADLEQNVGGIETLFKSSADKVIENAENAYKTAGMSANQYMETVTGFSASLLQSLGGDTEKAADSANMALIDMADNANKMGTSMESIQWAYQGFAKQNFTMLDNLKLGYGGTKEEMERLLADAQKLTGVKYDISNLNDVFNAIHVIQGELGITGTTAQEAATTITGSISSMKSAFDNFLNGSGTIGELIETGITAIQNIVNAAGELLPNLIQSIADGIPQIIEGINQIFPQILDLLLTNTPSILSSVGQILSAIGQTIIEYLPQVLELGMQLIGQLIQGIAQMLPELIPQAITAVLNLVETLLDNIDLLIDAGIQLIIGLADGLIAAIPQLIEKIPTIIEKLLNAIIDNLPKLVEMGIQLVVKLAVGLVKAIPQLVSKIPELIGAVLQALTRLPEMVIDIGKNIVSGIWEGISNMASWLWNKISSWCGDIFNNIKSFFGIHSPSILFNKEIGQMLGLGLGEGFDDSLSSVYKDMQKAIEHENAKLTSNLTNTHQIQVQNEDNRQATLKSIDDNKEIVVNTTTKLDNKVIARGINKVNARQKLQYGLA